MLNDDFSTICDDLSCADNINGGPTNIVGAWVDDHVTVVCDEIVGQWVAGLIMWPCLASGWTAWLVCFFWFRFFDVLKMGPVRWFDQMENDFGVLFLLGK